MINEDENFVSDLNSENIYNDLNSDYLNENDLLDSDNSTSSSEDSPKYHLKGIDENDTFCNITDFEMEALEGAQAKLEGSLLRRMKNFLIDEKGMLTNTLESENMTITQASNESLTTLT